MIAALLLAFQAQLSVPQPQPPMPAAQPAVPPDQVTPPRQVYVPSIAQYYPPEAMAKGEQGVTILRCVLDATGRLIDCTLHASSGSTALDTAAFRIAEGARYAPQTVGGKPVDVKVNLPVRWILAE